MGHGSSRLVPDWHGARQGAKIISVTSFKLSWLIDLQRWRLRLQESPWQKSPLTAKGLNASRLTRELMQPHVIMLCNTVEPISGQPRHNVHQCMYIYIYEIWRMCRGTRWAKGPWIDILSWLVYIRAWAARADVIQPFYSWESFFVVAKL